MKRLWQILALTLMALMVPASVCCLVPQPEEKQPCKYCSIPQQDHDLPSQQDACPSSAIAHSQLPAVAAMPEMQLVELCDILNALSRLREQTDQAVTPLFSSTTAPPGLRMTWVFVSRAALPARAPSELA